MGLFAWAFLAAGASLASWTLATPLMAAPDEPNHVVQAAAVVRGEWDEREEKGPAGLQGIARVPEWVAQGESLPLCFAFKPHVSAGCAPKMISKATTVPAPTQFSNYPPLYYAIVGIPSLIFAGAHAVYAMRFLGDLVNTAFIALGLFLLARYHPRRSPLVGAMIALSPMVLFVTAVVNSSGMESAAAFAAWCGGLCVIEHEKVPLALAVYTAIAFVFLILNRPISPVNAAVIVVVLAILVGWRSTMAWLKERTLRPIWVPALLAVIVAGIFLLIGGLPHLLGYPTKPRLTLAGSIWLSLRQTGSRLRQCVGDFGWLDTPVPLLVAVIWASAVVGFLAPSLILSPRCRRALPFLALAIVAMPVIFEAPKINAIGLYWQGRYWLPTIVGIPLVASTLRRDRPLRPERSSLSSSIRLIGLPSLGALLIVGQVVAFLTALHRYQTGLGAAPGTPLRWSPPGGASDVLGLLIAGQVLLLGFVVFRTRKGRVVQPMDSSPTSSGAPGAL